MSAEPTAECTYDELVRIYRENAALGTIDQCQTAITALNQLALIQPAEIEAGGERVSMRDIERRIDQAEKKLVILTMSAVRTSVICPADCLR